MGTYKVLQDIEADDKLLGPLSLKQFGFAAITVILGFIQFKLITGGGPFLVKFPFMVALLLPMIMFGFLAAPLSRDQPNEIWLLARLRFILKPRKRIWDQTGMSELVTITAPKKIEVIRTNGLSQEEVRSRLQALANTLDSRGWAVKNVNVNLYAEPDYINDAGNTDRLVGVSSLPQDVPAVDVHAADDIMDANNNAVAQHLDQLIKETDQGRREQLLASIRSEAAGKPVTPPANYWFMNQSDDRGGNQDGYATFDQSSVVSPGAQDDPVPEPTSAEADLLKAAESHDQNKWQHHLKTIQPPGTAPAPAPAASSTSDEPQNHPVTPAPNPAILGLASNDDLNVATIARQAQKLTDTDNEVVISLR